jgi:hypothetical protein
MLRVRERAHFAAPTDKQNPKLNTSGCCLKIQNAEVGEVLF